MANTWDRNHANKTHLILCSHPPATATGRSYIWADSIHRGCILRTLLREKWFLTMANDRHLVRSEVAIVGSSFERCIWSDLCKRRCHFRAVHFHAAWWFVLLLLGWVHRRRMQFAAIATNCIHLNVLPSIHRSIDWSVWLLLRNKIDLRSVVVTQRWWEACEILSIEKLH